MQELKPARGRGFYLMPKQSDDATIEVTNHTTGRRLALFDNGIGGVSAQLQPRQFYRVKVSRPAAVVGYFVSTWSDETGVHVSQPYNHFSEVPVDE